jgi:hypothetical protein
LGLYGKIITGFEGAAGRLLAVQQGDADVTVMNPDNALLAQSKGQCTTIMQVGLTRTKPGENLPTMMEFVKAESLNDNQKKLLDSFDFLWDAKQIFTSPDVPKERVAFMAEAFKKVVENPDFRAEMSKATSTEIGPYISGEELGKRANTLAGKKDVVTLWNEMLNKHVK